METTGQLIDTLIYIKDKFKNKLDREELDAINNACNIIEHTYGNTTSIYDALDAINNKR